MEQTEKVKRFSGKSEFVEIEGVQLEVKPLGVKNFDLIAKMNDSNVLGMKDVIVKVLKDNNLTQEEIDNFPWKYFKPIVNAVLKVNGIEVDEEKEKFLDDIRRAQQQQPK